MSRRGLPARCADRFTVVCDRDFDAVIDGCAEPGPGARAPGSTPASATLYRGLFEIGHCHTVEVYDGEALVGGLYGVSLGRAFFGESMFHRARDASKVALVHLVARLRAGGYRLLDTQFVTDHLKTFGATAVSAALSQSCSEAAVRDEADIGVRPRAIRCRGARERGATTHDPKSEPKKHARKLRIMRRRIAGGGGQRLAGGRACFGGPLLRRGSRALRLLRRRRAPVRGSDRRLLRAFAVGQPHVVDRVLDRVQAGARGEHPAGEDALDLALQRDLVDLDEGVGVRRLGRRAACSRRAASPAARRTAPSR